jgi:hypothetical protein
MNRYLFSAVAVATLLVPLNQLAAQGAQEGLDDISNPATGVVVDRLPTSALLSLQPESRLWLEGGSTVRGYSCAATEIIGKVRTAQDQPLPALTGLAGVVREAGITIPVAQLDCDNGTMNGHMKKALKADEHETIAYRFDTFEIVAAGEGGGQVEMKGHLTIAGQELPIVFPAEIELMADGTIRLQGQTELDMTKFGVKPPRLMLGTLKVHDQVTVHFDVLFRS